MRRREIVGLIGAIACACMPAAAARAQQSALPTIGFLSSRSPEEAAHHLEVFREGLKEVGYVERENVSVEYRWARGDYDRLPVLASELTSRRVAVIAAVGGNVSAVTAKTATNSIPVIFIVGADPVRLGLVASLHQPGTNATGMSVFTTDLGVKRLELLHALVPHAFVIGLLVNPNYHGSLAEAETVKAAAQQIGRQVIVLTTASNEHDIERVFAELAQERIHALLVDADALFVSRRDRLVELTAGLSIPAVYDVREFVTAGGLMGYGASLTDAYRRAGVYVGRVLKGAEPAHLPVQQPTKFEMVLNLKTAKALGLTVPPTLLARADEVIE